MSKRVKMKIHGMHCDHCAKGLEDHLSKLPQVKQAAVSFPQHSAIIDWDGEAVYEPTLRGAVRDAGFEVVDFE